MVEIGHGKLFSSANLLFLRPLYHFCSNLATLGLLFQAPFEEVLEIISGAWGILPLLIEKVEQIASPPLKGVSTVEGPLRLPQLLVVVRCCWRGLPLRDLPRRTRTSDRISSSLYCKHLVLRFEPVVLRRGPAAQLFFALEEQRSLSLGEGCEPFLGTAGSLGASSRSLLAEQGCLHGPQGREPRRSGEKDHSFGSRAVESIFVEAASPRLALLMG